MEFFETSDHIRGELDRDISEGDVLGSDEELMNSDDENDLLEVFEENEELSATAVSTPSVNDDSISADIHPNDPIQNANNPECPICKWEHNGDFHPRNLPFDSSNSGIVILDGIVGNEWKEVDAFYEFIDFDFVQHIAVETNKYYKQCSIDVRSQYSKLNNWVDTNADEMFCFLATSLLMPHLKKNSLKQYWSTDPLLETPIFSKIFSQDRYLNLRRMLHFDDNLLITGNDEPIQDSYCD